MNVWVPATWATAMVNSVSAAASLIRLSPVRIAMTGCGRPNLPPTATAVTASGGATIAPRIRARPKVSGTSTNHADTAATANAVTTTNPTPRPRIGRMFRRNVGNEKPSAAEYSSGGSTTVSRMCESSSGGSKSGKNDTTIPTTTMIRAGSSPRRWAMAVTTMAPTTTRINSTGRLSRGDRDAAALLLAGGTPEEVATLQHGSTDRRRAHPTRLPRPAVHVGAGSARPVCRGAVVVRGPDHDDLAATHADLHQRHQIGPHIGEFVLPELSAEAVRVDTVAEQQLTAVHVADAGDHRLIHQQRANRP